VKRLTPASLTLFMFLIVGGLVVAYVVKGLNATDRGVPQVLTKLIPTPVGDIQPGTLITEQHLGQTPIVVSTLEMDMLQSTRVLTGRYAKEKLPAGTPIRINQLYAVNEVPPLKLDEGMVAKTIDLLGSSAMVGGNIRPGQYVDVHFTPNAIPNSDLNANGLTMTLFKGVKLVAMRSSGDSSQTSSVTFELTPVQANILELSRQKGTLTLAYNPQGKGDGKIAVKHEDRVTLEEILGLAKPEPPAPPFTSQIYRGGGRQELQFMPHNSLNERQGGYIPNGGNTNAIPFNGTNDRSSGFNDANDDTRTSKKDERLNVSPYTGASPLGSNFRGIQRFSSL